MQRPKIIYCSLFPVVNTLIADFIVAIIYRLIHIECLMQRRCKHQWADSLLSLAKRTGNHRVVYATSISVSRSGRLLQLLRARLSDSGWTDSLDAYSRGTGYIKYGRIHWTLICYIDIIKSKNLEDVSFEDLIKEIGDHGRCSVYFIALSHQII